MPRTTHDQRAKCRVCQTQLGRYHAYVLTLEQTVTQLSPQPPCHLTCALSDAEQQAASVGGVFAVWSTKFIPAMVRNELKGGVTEFHLDAPDSIRWIAGDGKAATYAEIETGFQSALVDIAARIQSDDESSAIAAQLAALHHFMPRNTTTPKSNEL